MDTVLPAGSLCHRLNRAGSKQVSRVPLPVRDQLALYLRRGVPVPWTPCSPPVHCHRLNRAGSKQVSRVPPPHRDQQVFTSCGVCPLRGPVRPRFTASLTRLLAGPEACSPHPTPASRPASFLFLEPCSFTGSNRHQFYFFLTVNRRQLYYNKFYSNL